eukprot:1216657-Prymnesium_polylepis.1
MSDVKVFGEKDRAFYSSAHGRILEHCADCHAHLGGVDDVNLATGHVSGCPQVLHRADLALQSQHTHACASASGGLGHIQVKRMCRRSSTLADCANTTVCEAIGKEQDTRADCCARDADGHGQCRTESGGARSAKRFELPFEQAGVRTDGRRALGTQGLASLKQARKPVSYTHLRAHETLMNL